MCVCVFDRMLQRTQSAHNGTPGNSAGGSCLHRNHQRLLQRRRPQQVGPQFPVLDNVTITDAMTSVHYRMMDWWNSEMTQFLILLWVGKMKDLWVSFYRLIKWIIPCSDKWTLHFSLNTKGNVGVYVFVQHDLWDLPLLSLCPRCVVKITGEMVLSFPAGITRHFSSHPTQPVLTFSISNYSRLEQVLPNPQLLCW